MTYRRIHSSNFLDLLSVVLSYNLSYSFSVLFPLIITVSLRFVLISHAALFFLYIESSVFVIPSLYFFLTCTVLLIFFSQIFLCFSYFYLYLLYIFPWF